MPTPLNGSILKGFQILSLFSSERQEITTALVVNQLQINNATAHRLLLTLENAGALRSTQRGVFALGAEIERLGWVAEEANSTGSIIKPELEALSTRLQESVMASRLTRHGPTCIAVANSKRAISVNIKVGALLPLYTSAQGKLWLAEMSEHEKTKRIEALSTTGAAIPDQSDLNRELQKIRTQGFSLNLGDNEPDIAAVSAPLRDADGTMVLSISTFGMLSRFNEDFIKQAVGALRLTADQIGKKM